MESRHMQIAKHMNKNGFASPTKKDGFQPPQEKKTGLLTATACEKESTVTIVSGSEPPTPATTAPRLSGAPNYARHLLLLLKNALLETAAAIEDTHLYQSTCVNEPA